MSSSLISMTSSLPFPLFFSSSSFFPFPLVLSNHSFLIFSCAWHFCFPALSFVPLAHPWPVPLKPVPVLRFLVPLPLVVGSLKTVDCKPVSFVRKTILSSFSFCETSFIDRAHCRQVWILCSWLLLFSCCWCLFLCCCCWFLFCCSLGSCPASDFFLQLFNLFLILCSFLQKAFHHLLQLLDPVVFLAAAAFLSFSCLLLPLHVRLASLQRVLLLPSAPVLFSSWLPSLFASSPVPSALLLPLLLLPFPLSAFAA